MSFKSLFLVPVMLISGCASNLTTAPESIKKQLLGSWDEASETLCSKPHQITFSDDDTVMNVEYHDVGWVTKEDKRKVFKYSVLSVIPNGLRVSLEDETRLDAQGNPVVWHIKIMNENAYCWGRDDWRRNGCTPPRHRCSF